MKKSKKENKNPKQKKDKTTKLRNDASLERKKKSSSRNYDDVYLYSDEETVKDRDINDFRYPQSTYRTPGQTGNSC